MIELFQSPDLRLNLLATAIGIIVEITFVVLILSWLTTRRENRRLLPVQSLLARQLFLTRSLILIAAQSAIEPYESIQENEAFAIRRHLVNPLRHHIAKLERMIDVYAVALKGDLLPSAIQFFSACDRLTTTLLFVLQSFDPTKASEDFLVEKPFDELTSIDVTYSLFRRRFPGVVDPIRDSVPHITDVMISWDRVHTHRPNLSTSLSAPTIKGQATLNVMDLEVVRRANIPASVQQISTMSRAR